MSAKRIFTEFLMTIARFVLSIFLVRLSALRHHAVFLIFIALEGKPALERLSGVSNTIPVFNKARDLTKLSVTRFSTNIRAQ